MNNKKYSTSINNQKCLGPCYRAGQFILHPTLLTWVTDKDNPFCPTNKWEHEGKEEIIDNCSYVSKTDEDSGTLAANIISPYVTYKCDSFLKIYYDIHDHNSLFKWIEDNENEPTLTKLRILNCGWKTFGKDNNYLSDPLIDIYADIIKKYWIKKLYPVFGNKLSVKGNSINLGESNKNKDKIVKINYMMDKVYTHNNLYRILDFYVKDNKKNWSEISDHNNKILEMIVDFTRKKLVSN